MLNVTVEVNGVSHDMVSYWDCYPKRFIKGQATPKSNRISVPYANGTLNSRSWAGKRPVYGDRQIQVPIRIGANDAEKVHSQIDNFLNGQDGKLFSSEDPDYYWKGEFKVGSYSTNGGKPEFTLVMTAYPYMQYKDVTVIEKTLDSNGRSEFDVEIDPMPCLPVIECQSSVSGTINGTAFSVSDGNPVKLSIVLKESNHIVLTGTAGTLVTIRFQEGKL